MTTTCRSEQIHITTDRNAGKRLSHFWGPAMLPAGYPYPEYIDSDGDPWPYNFICQIDLGDIAPLDTGNLLPHKGLLSFFCKIDHYLGNYGAAYSIGGCISDAEDVKVLYFPDCDGFEEIMPADEDGNPLYPQELPVVFSDRPKKRHTEEHALFAPPAHREWENWDHPFEDWIILLQVDSFEGTDFNLNFMDCGVLVFLISPEDLSARRFDNVRAIVLST